MAFPPKKICEFILFLKSKKITARLVGGCVRDYLLSKTTTDYDIAVSCPITDLKKKLQDNRIKSYDLGIEFGSLGVILPPYTLEVTSLREEITYKGRHPIVKFTDSFEKDALRRDFTINALYMDENGTIFDPTTKGIEDLKNGVVRFIGNPIERLAEDPLRLLRFFRFYAYLGKKTPEKDVLETLTLQKDSLLSLSKERIHQEIRKLLSLKDPYGALQLMKETHIFGLLFKGHLLEKKKFLALCPLGRFYSLIKQDIHVAIPNWRFSKKDKNQLLLFHKIEQHRFEYGNFYCFYYYPKEILELLEPLFGETFKKQLRSWHQPIPDFNVQEMISQTHSLEQGYKLFKEKEKQWVIDLSQKQNHLETL